MLNARYNGLSTSLLVALIGFGLAGCSDDDPVGPGTLPSGEFDPVATAQALDNLESKVGDNNDYLMALQLTGVAIAVEGGLSVATDYAAAGLTGWTEPTMVRSFVLSGSAAPIFPANLLGKTFTWDQDLGRYAVSEDTGAPANGVRFIVYAMNPLTHMPTIPLNAVGHLDMTDEGSPESTRIGIKAVSDGVTLIDYFIDASFTITAEEYSVVLDAVGFLSDGVTQVDFDLNQTASMDMQTQSLVMDVQYAVSVPSQGISVLMSLTGDFGMEGPLNATTNFAVSDGVNTAIFSLTITESENIEGSLRYNGQPVLNITGTFEEAVFTRADGGELTEEDLEALQEILNLAGDVFEFAAEILGGFEGGL